MQTMSYFHLAPSTAPSGKTKPPPTDPPLPLDWNPTPLATRRPTVVKYSGKGGVSAICSYHHQPHPDDLADSILGRTVAIVELESPSQFSNISERQTRVTPEGLPYIVSDEPLDPASSNTLGLALIRGLDPSTRTMDVIISPGPGGAAPLTRISAAVKAGRPLVLVSGSFDPPAWFYVEEKVALAQSEERAGRDGDKEQVEEEMEIITDEGTSEDTSEAEGDDVIPGGDQEDRRKEDDDIPWVEVLRGHQKRGVGAKVWRVRRDLGRRGD